MTITVSNAKRTAVLAAVNQCTKRRARPSKTQLKRYWYTPIVAMYTCVTGTILSTLLAGSLSYQHTSLANQSTNQLTDRSDMAPQQLFTR
jgi:hypothetical protein